jgi:predicted RND superfamily exporter protein
VLERHRTSDLRLEVVGGEALPEISMHDMTVYTGVSIGIILVTLVVLFRRTSAALLSMLIVLISLASTFGWMGWVGIPFTIPVQILPSFLIAVGICDAVHILTIVYQGRDRGESREDAVAGAIAHSGLAVVMTSVTTAGGLASFLAAELAPVASLGILAPAGIMLALGYSLTLLPALLATLPLSERSRFAGRDAAGERVVGGRLLRGAGAWSARHPRGVLLGAAIIIIVAGMGLPDLRLGHDPLSWLLPDDPVRLGMERFDAKMGGSNVAELLIDSGEENGLYEPDVLRRIEAAAEHALAQGPDPVRVTKATSLVDLVKEIHQALNGGDPAARVLPDSRPLIAQEILLFENSGSEDVEKVADSSLRTARLTLSLGWSDGLYYSEFLREQGADLRRILGDDLTLSITGASALSSRAFELLLGSMTRSLAVALAIITPLMILLIGSVRRGVLSMIPNLVPVYLTLCVMGWLGIPLNMSTLMIGSIVIGVAVDDTIHFMHKFNRYYDQTGDATLAVDQTLATTGSALFVTSVVLAASFLVFMLGEMVNLRYFGTLIAFATVAAFLADLLLSPALMVLSTRRAERAHPAE